MTSSSDFLNDAFTREGVCAALRRYKEFAQHRKWPISHKVDLWNAGAIAADVTSCAEDRRAASGHIYDSLARYWKVFRGKSRSSCWSADTVFEFFFERESILNRRAGMRASQWHQYAQPLVNWLHTARSLKPNKYFPWMPVSKFGHFANPRLMPVYDEDVVWKIVFLQAFRNDCIAFADRNRLERPQDGPEFLRSYAAWIGELISRDAAILPIFAAWIRDHVGDSVDVPDDTETYEAAAGEMILIGAAHRLLDARR